MDFCLMLQQLRYVYARPRSVNAFVWWAAASAEKQQNTTWVTVPGWFTSSDATVPTAISAARSAGKR